MTDRIPDNILQWTREIPVGDPEYFAAYKRVMETRDLSDTSPIELDVPLTRHKMVVKNTFIQDVDINGDGFSDVVGLVAFRTGYGTAGSPYKWASIVSLSFGGPPSQVPGKSRENAINAHISPLSPEPMDAVNSAKKMIGAGADQATFDQNIASAVYSVMTFAHYSKGYFYLASKVDPAISARALDLSVNVTENLRDNLDFTMPSLERMISRSKHAGNQRIMENILRELSRDNEPAEVYFSAMGSKWNASARSLGPKACGLKTYGDIYVAAQFEPEPQRAREDMILNALYIDLQKSGGGLFDPTGQGFTAVANRYARNAGHDNYASMQFMQRYGSSDTEYEKTTTEYLSGKLAAVNSFISGLKRFAGEKRPVTEFNSYTIHREKIASELKRLGCDRIPAISKYEAVEAAKRYFKDMGFDLDFPPQGGEIILDFEKREGADQAVHIPIGDGMSSVVRYSMPEELTLYDIAGFFHEIGHAIHYYYGSAGSDGGFAGGSAGASPGVREAIAGGFENVVYSKAWVDRYLLRYLGFTDPKVRKLIAEESSASQTHFRCMTAAVGLWETSLYKDYDCSSNECRERDMEERLNYWGELGKKYLGYDDVGIPTSKLSNQNLYHMHFAWKPLYFPSYSIGDHLTDRITGKLAGALERGDEWTLKKSFFDVAEFLGMGGSIRTVKEAEDFLDRLPGFNAPAKP